MADGIGRLRTEGDLEAFVRETLDRSDAMVRLRSPAVTIAANLQTVSYTLVAGDAGRVVEMNSASATVLTIPANATVPFPVGTVLEVARIGAGAVTIAAAGGVTAQSRGGLLAVGNQYASVGLRKRATDTWIIIGDLA